MTIFLPKSGGKAGKGHNKTSNFQVRNGCQILKQFRFKVGDFASRDSALVKAQAFIQSKSTN